MTRKLRKRCHTPVCFSLFPFSSFSLVFLSLNLTSSSFLSFLQLNTIKYDLSLHIIQIVCLHFSRSTPLGKTLTVNHFLRIEYYQQTLHPLSRVTTHDPSLVPNPRFCPNKTFQNTYENQQVNNLLWSYYTPPHARTVVRQEDKTDGPGGGEAGGSLSKHDFPKLKICPAGAASW